MEFLLCFSDHQNSLKVSCDNEIQFKIRALRDQHKDLDMRISELVAQKYVDSIEIQNLKKKKLYLKDQIEILVSRSSPDTVA